MAIAIVQKAGTHAAASTVQVTLSGVAAGNAIIILAYSFNNTTWSITDSNGTPVQNLSFQDNLYVTRAWSVLNTNAGTHVLDLVGGNVNSMIHAWEISGLATSSAFDQSATNVHLSVSSMTLGPTPTTTVADELVIGAIHGVTPGVYTSPGSADLLYVFDATFNRNMGSAVKIVSATGAQTLAFACTATTNHESILATYKMASAVVAAESVQSFIVMF